MLRASALLWMMINWVIRSSRRLIVEAQNQRVGQAGFVVGPVGACVDGDVAVAIYGPQGREGDAVAEDLFRRESADRLGSGEFALGHH